MIAWSLQPALRTSKMFEVVNVVKKLGEPAYIGLYESIVAANGAQCSAAQTLVTHLPLEYRRAAGLPVHMAAPILTYHHSFASEQPTPSTPNQPLFANGHAVGNGPTMSPYRQNNMVGAKIETHV
jgi:hypothetical protein